MRFKPRVSVRVLLVVVALCGVGSWLGKAWLFPNRIPGLRFALIGPMDIDRDGIDDRARLKWLIVRNGGIVDYDLPVAGPATGAIGGRTYAYIVGEPPRGSSVPATFLEARADAISEARANAVRPLTIKKLLDRLEGKPERKR